LIDSPKEAKMKHGWLIAILAALALSGCGTHFATVKNARGDDVMLLGYDPVAYFTIGKPTRGKKEIASTLPGRTYYFANAEHKTMFDATPVKYEPLYGGFCSNGAPYKVKLGSDPTEFEIVNGRLFIFGDILGREMWKLHRDENIANADRVWPEIAGRGWRAASLSAYMNKVPWYRTGAELHAEYERQNPGKKLTYNPGGMFTNLFLKQPGWRAAEGFGQTALGYPE
jgi:YHS domain-containing protein